MDLKTSIEQDRSKENMHRIANYVRNNPDELQKLWELMIHGDDSMKLRSSWAFGRAIELHGALFMPFMVDSLTILMDSKHDGIKRNLMRSFFYAPLNQIYISPLFDLCCSFIHDPNEKVAVRMFSMRVGLNIIKANPGLVGEYILVLENVSGSMHSSGLQNSYAHVLNESRKMNSN